MPNPQLDEYVKQQRASGAADPQILAMLQQAGWPAADVAVALGMPSAPAPVPPASASAPRPPVGSGAPIAPVANPLAGLKMPAMDAKMTSIITQCVIFNVIGTAISDGGRFASQFFITGPLGQFQQLSNYYSAMVPGYANTHTRFWLMTPTHLVSNLVFSAIGGAVLGFVVAAYWGPVRQYAHQYSGGFLNSPFKIMFFPTLIASLFGLLGTFAFGIMTTLIMIVTAIVGRYVFAKGVSGVIEKNFPSA